ncbi:MAG TPA: PepSY domain-containing protein [Edaphobacter sp.]|nr:PepSY domain-containing protein [Edaphobacter sp.]
MSRSTANAFLRICRLTHLYLGIFTAPALIFFAFTGALQTFSLHETTRGSSYKPPAWIVTLGQIHKKQTPVVGKRPAGATGAPNGSSERRPQASATSPANEARGVSPAPARSSVEPSSARKHHPLPLKIFFLVVSIGLFLSTLTGIYMSYKYTRSSVTVTTLLILGTVIPVALVFI